MNTTAFPAPAGAPRAGSALPARAIKAAFNAFAALRVAAYIPTAWAIAASADSTQHSLVTWLVFAGANATLAARLYGEQGRRFGGCVAVSTVNGLMCLVVAGLIGWYRI